MKLGRAFYYIFQSRTASIWNVGRVMLAGDSAHVFPPFGGQGIQAGFLDVSGLAWRLDIVLQPSNVNKAYSRILKGWADERRSQITYTLNYTMQIGNILMETNPWKTFARDWALNIAQMIPSVRRSLERPPIDPPEYKYEEGMQFLSHLGGGKCWFQIYCKRLGKEEGVTFSDDLIFDAEKKSMFQLVVLLDTIEDLPAACEQLKGVKKGLIETGNMIDEATYIVQDSHADHATWEKLDLETKTTLDVFRVSTAKEFAVSALCREREAPEGYEESRLKKSTEGKTFIIIRPDRFVFASCKDMLELSQAIEVMGQILECNF